MHPTLSTQQCPLCGDNNQCAQAVANATGEPAAACWCFNQRIPTHALEQIPPASRALRCICQRCANTPPADEAISVSI